MHDLDTIHERNAKEVDRQIRNARLDKQRQQDRAWQDDPQAAQLDELYARAQIIRRLNQR